jgi:hypothetical protein
MSSQSGAYIPGSIHVPLKCSESVWRCAKTDFALAPSYAPAIYIRSIGSNAKVMGVPYTESGLPATEQNQ